MSSAPTAGITRRTSTPPTTPSHKLPGALNELSRRPPIAAGRLSVSAIRASAARGAGPDGRRFWIPVFLLPFLLLYGGFTLWPLNATAYYSLFYWDGIRPLSDFIWLGNYHTIVADPIFCVA